MAQRERPTQKDGKPLHTRAELAQMHPDSVVYVGEPRYITRGENKGLIDGYLLFAKPNTAGQVTTQELKELHRLPFATKYVLRT